MKLASSDMDHHKQRRFPGIILLGFTLLGVLMAIITIPNVQYILPYLQKNAASERTIQIGKPAPKFTAQTVDGHQVDLDDLLGSVVAVTFWATWCEPCKAEMPLLQEAASQYRDEHLVILAVNAGESINVIEDFVSARQLSLPIVLDPRQDIRSKYGISALPVTIWIDSAGVIRGQQIGPATPESIQATLQKLDVIP